MFLVIVLTRRCRALYIKGDRFEASDAVFGVKQSLIVELQTVTEEECKSYGVEAGTKCIRWDFVLVSEKEAAALKHKNAEEAMKKLGILDVSIVDGLPVPDVD